MRIRTANKRRKRKERHSLRDRLLVSDDVGKVLDFMRAEYIRDGYLSSGCVGIFFLSTKLALSWNAANNAIDLLLARKIIRIRKCVSRSLELSPSERVGLIKKYHLAVDWQNRGACFRPLHHQFGEIARVSREAEAYEQSRLTRAGRLT